MDSNQLYEYLENLAEQLGISIRYEDLSAHEPKTTSGLCKVKGRLYYIMDRSKPLPEKISLLKECLRQTNLEGVYLLPAVRQLLQEGRSNGTDP